MDTKTENQEIEVIEEAPDGSAVVELPEGEEPPVEAHDADADAHDDTDEVREASVPVAAPRKIMLGNATLRRMQG